MPVWHHTLSCQCFALSGREPSEVYEYFSDNMQSKDAFWNVRVPKFVFALIALIYCKVTIKKAWIEILRTNVLYVFFIFGGYGYKKYTIQSQVLFVLRFYGPVNPMGEVSLPNHTFTGQA